MMTQKKRNERKIVGKGGPNVGAQAQLRVTRENKSFTFLLLIFFFFFFFFRTKLLVEAADAEVLELPLRVEQALPGTA